MKTPEEVLQSFLDQIVLKQVRGSVYLVPAIMDIQIEEFKKALKERDQEWKKIILTTHKIMKEFDEQRSYEYLTNQIEDLNIGE